MAMPTAVDTAAMIRKQVNLGDLRQTISKTAMTMRILGDEDWRNRDH